MLRLGYLSSLDARFSSSDPYTSPIHEITALCLTEPITVRNLGNLSTMVVAVGPEGMGLLTVKYLG